jgi:hypothetical protein
MQQLHAMGITHHAFPAAVVCVCASQSSVPCLHLHDGVLQLLGCLANLIELLDLEYPVARGALTQYEGGALQGWRRGGA